MAYELKDGQGSLFRNDKDGNEKRPDYKGQANIGGTLYSVSGWIKEGQKGKWMSLKIEPPGERTQNVIREASRSMADDAPPF